MEVCIKSLIPFWVFITDLEITKQDFIVTAAVQIANQRLSVALKQFYNVPLNRLWYQKMFFCARRESHTELRDGQQYAT